jgi:hypothetical protein
VSPQLLQSIVEQGGGIFRGRMEHLVLFDSPATHSTLALHENNITASAVSSQIRESDRKFYLADCEAA